jgi:hypothetical protein
VRVRARAPPLALLASRSIFDDRARVRWSARCLDAQAQSRSRDDLRTAVEAVGHAGTVCPSPEIIVHLLELYEAQASDERDPQESILIVKQPSARSARPGG